jgi:transcriptional regulator with XRE-family HTH domain
MSRTLPEFDPAVGPTAQTLMHLGKLVRNRRAQAQMRIDDAAALSGVSSDVLSRLENGKPVTVDKLMLVLDGLGLRMLVVPKTDLPAIEALLGQAADPGESP